MQVTGPGGTDTQVKSAYIEVKAPAPVANFTGNGLEGPAPLTVTFQNASTGQISAYAWNFGDGSTSSQTAPSHTYTKPGVYAVTLAVSGPSGANTLTRSAYVKVAMEAPLEVGEVSINQDWQRSPTRPPSSTRSWSSSHWAATTRTRPRCASRVWMRPASGSRCRNGVTLMDMHANETAGYLVVERGRHQLPDGAWIEAGRLQTPTTNTFLAKAFSQAFGEVPVVFATVTSVNEADTVTTRLRKITAQGFQVVMQEQQSSSQRHQSESIDYIACESSFGLVNGMDYAVGLMDAKVSSAVYSFLYPDRLLTSPAVPGRHADHQRCGRRESALAQSQ